MSLDYRLNSKRKRHRFGVGPALRPKALTILARDNERLDHLGFLYSHQNVVSRLSELIQLREPELKARVVRVGKVVRIPAQIAEELHQHKRAVEFRGR